MKKTNRIKPLISAIFIFLLSFHFLQGADSSSYPVTAGYCDGSTVDIYPFSFVTRTDGSAFNCYDVLATPIPDGYRYAFEDKDDADYNDIIIELWITGNNTSKPVAHIKYISKEASYLHWIYIIYNGTQQLVFKAEDASPGAVFDIPLPVKECGDFEIKAAPPQRTIEQGDSTHYNITIKALNGFTEDTNLGVEGLPAGASGEFQPNPLPITGEAKLNITTTAEVPVGIYTLTITGTAGEIGHSTQVTLEIREKPQPDFTIEADPVTRTVYPGESAGYKIKPTSVNGFSKKVRLSIDGLPTGVTAAFDPDKVKTGGESELTLTTSGNTPLGTYTLTVIGKGGNQQHSIGIILKIEEKPPDPDFEIKAEPGSFTLYRGEAADYTVAIIALNGFSGEVSLGVGEVPAGAAASFTADTITAAGTSQLKITTTTATPVGTYTLTVTAKSGGIRHSTTVELSVECRDFSIQMKAEPDRGGAPLTVRFESEAVNNDGFSDSDFRYSWNFGDNAGSDLKNPEHTFLAPGNYPVVLTVTGPCGQAKTASKNIEVEGFEGALSKSFSQEEALPGDEVFITIETKNGTRFDFTNITVEDQLSPHLEYIEDDAPVTPRRSGRELVWQFPSLKKGETLRFNIKVNVSENAPPGTVTNVAYLSHDSLAGKRISSNTASLTVNKIDVTLLKQVEQAAAQPGDTIKYQLTVKNNSNVPLTGVKLTDELSHHLEFISQTGKLTFSKQDRNLQWTGTIEAQQQEVIVFTGRIKHDTFSGTRILNRARMEAGELREPIESGTVETAVSSEPVSTTKVRFTKRSEVPQTEVGRVIRFSITAANMSDSPLISPVIEDYLPQGFSYVASSTLLNNRRFTEPQGKRRLLWQLPHINPNETVVIRYQVVIGADAKRGRNINRATLKTRDNSGQDIFLEASAYINVSTSGFIFYSSVEGTVYLDRNDDDFYSMEDTPLPGIEVRLSTGQKAVTDSTGHYAFESLFPGEYAVGVNTLTLPERYRLASLSPRAVVLSDGLSDTADFAVKFKGEDDVKNARLQGRVFFDKNRNLVYDSGDSLCEKFKAKLDHRLITDAGNGTFVFTRLEPGPHTIEIIYSEGTKTMKKEVTINKGKNYIDFPLKFSGIRIIIKGEKQ